MLRKINKKYQKLVFAMNTPQRRSKCILVIVSLRYKILTLYMSLVSYLSILISKPKPSQCPYLSFLLANDLGSC